MYIYIYMYIVLLFILYLSMYLILSSTFKYLAPFCLCDFEYRKGKDGQWLFSSSGRGEKEKRKRG